jgi:parvulin-like peptidyl-prolyl isomerase
MIKIIFLFIYLLASGSVIHAEDGLVAIVNNDAITQKDLNDFINFMRVQLSAQYSEQEVKQRMDQMLPDLILRLIEDRLILQAAYKENIDISPAFIKARIEQIKNNYASETDFQNALMARGLTPSDIELKMKEQLLMAEVIERKIKSKIVVKPQEVTDYYHEHIEEFNKPEQRLVRILTIKNKRIIKQIQQSIAEYEDLDSIAKDYSLEITDLDWVIAKQLKPEIADIVFSLGVNSLKAHIMSTKELYIFEVKGIKPPMKMSLFEIQDEINRFLFETKMQKALTDWLEELKSKAYITIKGNYVAD